jgi:hypothetical protein
MDGNVPLLPNLIPNLKPIRSFFQLCMLLNLCEPWYNEIMFYSLIIVSYNFYYVVIWNCFISCICIHIFLTLRSWVPLERPLVVKTLDGFPAFYASRRFITALARALHLFLSWARPIQFTSLHPTSPTAILEIMNIPCIFRTNAYRDCSAPYPEEGNGS